MRIFVISDFHGNTQAFKNVAAIITKPKADLIIICGDITNFGTVEQAKMLMSKLTSPQRPIFFVPGNCDPPSLTETTIPNAYNLHGNCKTFKNLSFIGVGGSPIGPLHTPFETTEKGILNVLNEGYSRCPATPQNKLVIVSHTPPHNTKLDLAFIGEHIGSTGIRQFIEEKKPAAVFCGHVHEGRGIDRIGETIIVNPGPARHGCYALVEFNEKIEATLEMF